MTPEQKTFLTNQAPAKPGVVYLIHQLYGYVSEVYTMPELEDKRKALHAMVDEVCNEIAEAIEGIRP